MKSNHPRFWLSSLSLAVCAIAIPALTFAQTVDVRTGGLMKGEKADSEGAMTINKSKSNVKNNRSEAGEPGSGAARAISESGVSVKSDPKKTK